MILKASRQDKKMRSELKIRAPLTKTSRKGKFSMMIKVTIVQAVNEQRSSVNIQKNMRNLEEKDFYKEVFLQKAKLL